MDCVQLIWSYISEATLKLSALCGSHSYWCSHKTLVVMNEVVVIHLWWFEHVREFIPISLTCIHI